MYLQENVQSLGAPPKAPELHLVELVFGGGFANSLIMVVLFLMLGVALYIYIDRILKLREVSKFDEHFIYHVKDLIMANKLKEAHELCLDDNSPVARLLEKGISRIGRPTDDIAKAIEGAGAVEVYKLEKNVNLLATFSGVGPMIGFLGTVVGMVISFHDMASVGGKPQIETLSSGIYTAMVTTIGGLIVGIVSYLSYNHIVIKTGQLLHKIETDIIVFMDTLNLMDR